MFRSHIKLKMDRDMWERLTSSRDDDEDEGDLVKELVNRYFENEDLRERNRELRDSLKEMRSQLKDLGREHRDLERDHEEQKNRYEDLRTEHNRLRKEHEELKENPIIEERVVYKEDQTKIRAITRKNDDLKKRIWEKQQEIERLQAEKEEAEAEVTRLEEALEEWRRRNFAVLVRGGSRIMPAPSEGLHDPAEEIELELMDSTSYYEWKGQRERFERDRDLKRGGYFIHILRH